MIIEVANGQPKTNQEKPMSASDYAAYLRNRIAESYDITRNGSCTLAESSAYLNDAKLRGEDCIDEILFV